MAPCQQTGDGQSRVTHSIPSKDLPPIQSFGPVFFRNQFRTKITTQTKDMYPAAKGKCTIVTGSNTGLGLEAARQLLSIGVSHLVMGVRSLERGHNAAARLRAEQPSASIDVWQLDMESYDSIEAFVRKVKDALPHLDVVILNAGLAAGSFEIVPETGHERTIQVNHISTVLLMALLLPVLKSKSRGGQDPPRLTLVNSVTAHLCTFPNKDMRPLLPSFDDTVVTPWDAGERYGVSKLLCQLFTVKLAEMMNPDDVIINMVDPGLTKGTDLGRGAKGLTALASKMFFSAAGRPVSKGAATYIDAVLGHGKESHGCFLMNCKIGPLACWYYTDGEVLTDVIWSETLRELGSTGVEEIINSIDIASSQNDHEIFRFVFKARDVTNPNVHDWKKHHQVSVTFSTFTKRFGVQRAFIYDGGDLLGDGVDEWIPRASMLRNQQLLRLWYDSYQWTASRPMITARDVDVVRGKERTRRALGKREGLYPLNHANKDWSCRCDRNIHLRFAHDEDFTVLWDINGGDCVVFDFREQSERDGGAGDEDGGGLAASCVG